jgi:hypothetical protein
MSPYRPFLAFIVGVALMSCSEKDSSLVTIRVREPKRLDTCHVLLHTVYDDTQPTDTKRRTAFIHTACDVPESVLKGPQWWGEGSLPPGFSLDVGDCMPLGGVNYCLEDVVHMQSATFKPTYFKPEHPKGKLRRIR